MGKNEKIEFLKCEMFVLLFCRKMDFATKLLMVEDFHIPAVKQACRDILKMSNLQSSERRRLCRKGRAVLAKLLKYRAVLRALITKGVKTVEGDWVFV